MRRSRPLEREGALAGVQLSEEERAGYVRRIEASLLASDEVDGVTEAAGRSSNPDVEGVT